MASVVPILNKPSITGKLLTTLEMNFIAAYVANGGNGTQAVLEAGYKTKSPAKYASALLRRDGVHQEIQHRLQQMEDAKMCSATEVLQFYSSVMRGEILDQFGLDPALDTRLKAANELAKHLIEIPQKLEQKNITNNIGSINLNFLPRKEEDIID